MPANGLLSFWDMQHIREILSDKTLLSVLIMDGEKARNISIHMDGKIVIGRTSCAFINMFFKDTKEISFTDFAFKVANALAGQSKNRNDLLFQGIAQVVLEKAIAKNDYHYVVDAIYDTLRYGWEGEHKSDFINMKVKDLPDYNSREHRRPGYSQTGEVRLNSGEVLIPRIEVEYKIRN